MDQPKDQGMIIMGLYNLWDYFLSLSDYMMMNKAIAYFGQKYLLGFPRKMFIWGIWDFEYP